jgi:thioredoxin-like negative regulator of GroEL
MKISRAGLRFTASWVLLGALVALGAEKVGPVSGSLKDALRKAGEAGKPLMIEFWRDGLADCQRQWEQMEEFPDVMNRFIYFRVNGPQNKPLAQQFGVIHYPTLIFLKPDGSEIYRQHGIHTRPGQLRSTLERVLAQAGPIAKSQKRPEPPSDKTPKGAAERQAYEAAAANDMKAAMNKLSVGRKAEAIKAFKQIVARYPGSQAAEQAQEHLDELQPENGER